MKPLENVQPLQALSVVHDNPLEQAPPPPGTRLGIASVDQLALKVLVSDDPVAAIENARALAEALVGVDKDGARLRTLARSIALLETEKALLDGLLMERIAKRDVQGVEMIERVLRGVTARSIKLIEAHRLESKGQQRAVAIAVGHADQVNITEFGEER